MADEPMPWSRTLPRTRALLALLAGLAASLIAAAPATALAGEAQPLAANPALEARMMVLASELRCLVCQNQTVADSHSDLAADLRQQIRDQLAAGRNEEQIRDFMTARYGDFVLYKPPLETRTALLWFGPGVLLVGSLAGLVWVLRRRSRMADGAFDPPTDDADEPGRTIA